jgi:uncharacterized protein (DUF885 family)
MLRFFIAAVLSAAFLGACGQAPPPPAPQAAPPGAPAERLSRLVGRYWDEYQSLNPLRLPEGPVVRFDPSAGYAVSPQFLADSLALERRYRDELMNIPRAALPAESQLTFDIFERERELAIEGFTYPSELMPVNPFRSLPVEFARSSTGTGTFAVLGARDYDNWQARADAYVRWTQQAIANMRDGLRRGYIMPRPVIARMLPLLSALGTDSPANVFYRPLSTIPASVPEAERRRFSEGITAAVREKILPAYRTLHDFLRDEYLPRARQTVGLSSLPLGQAWYAYLIRRETASKLSPAEIHALGVAETDRLHGRLQALIAETGFAGNAQAFFEAAQREPKVAFKTREELLDYYGQLKASVSAAVPTLFAQAPQEDFAIRALDSYEEAGAAPLSYVRAANRESPAVVYVDVRPQSAGAGLPSSGAGQPPSGVGPHSDSAGPESSAVPPSVFVPRTALFLREALPGHHFQIALQTERSLLPKFRRLGADPGFVEGWGLYAESLGDELGVYKDAESKFGSLADQLECAALLAVDTGIHALGWSRERALDFLKGQVPLSEARAAMLVDRSIALPAESLACGIGAHVIRGLRSHAEQVLGAHFDLRDFHSELIDDGAMPLDILESAANLWLDNRH